MQAITVVSLFDGISVGQLALHMAGIPIDKYIAFEIKKSAIQVTQKHFPNTIQMGDVRNVYWESIGHCDLLLGGSPCQDLSQAHPERKGLEGEKSSLFWQFVKAKNILKPKYFLLENVKMPAKDFETISQTLGIYPVNINSSLVTAQLRNRFYWTNIGDKNYNLFNFPTCAIPQPKDKNIYFSSIKENCVDHSFNISKVRAKRFKLTKQGSFGIIGTVKTRDDAIGQRCKVLGINGKIDCLTASDYKAPKILFDNGRLRYITPLECERLQTLPDNYTVGVSKSARYNLCGDSWTAEVIAHIFKFLKQELEKGEKEEW